MSLFDEEAKAYFLAAGYAVATIDVRPSHRCGLYDTALLLRA